ncbi:MAG: DNA gyrase inhibitor YacG [Pirellulaceae bacterium]|nr:DNA gyrase inhibitor YacG [Pirellulaceae bacterium]
MGFRKSNHRGSSPVRCPTCGRMIDPLITAVMPFCSERCQQIDLGRWFDEEIGLPVEPEIEFNEERSSED